MINLEKETLERTRTAEDFGDKANKPVLNERVISQKKNPYKLFITIVTAIASFATIYGAARDFSKDNTPVPISNLLPNQDDSGALDAVDGAGNFIGTCPLKHTSVDAKVSGYIARVTVRQVFRNSFNENIEARYRFPLSADGAVDEMTMRIGDRVINGTIKRREEAKAIYESAKRAGHSAALLNQERTNIFTQSVANLQPGKEIEITIKYTETLPYKDGGLQFVFPTVVGPRFRPYGSTTGDQPFDVVNPVTWETVGIGNGGAKNRAGHDISINVAVDAGLPVRRVTSKLHEIIAQHPTPNQVFVSLKKANSIPNRDFVLDIDVAQSELKTGYLASKKSGEDGYITLMVMPPVKVQPKEIAPRELIFLVDCSGSQAGAPLAKSKETLHYVIDHANPNDTFQVVTFSDQVNVLFPHPGHLTLSRKLEAKAFVDRIAANGGTWMAPAVEAVCNAPTSENRLRIVSFMTDGFVGNDLEVVDMIKKFRGKTRWFSFGVGDSVNRALIDGIAREGGGEADYVLLNSSAEEVGRKFYEKISTPVLTDVKLRAEGVELFDVYPGQVADVWSQKPLFYKGRYRNGGWGLLHVDGFYKGKRYRQTLALDLPENDQSNAAIGQIWARAKIDDLMSKDLSGVQSGSISQSLKNEITETALAHHLMSQFTSFVAVDTNDVASTTSPILVDVPLEAPQIQASQSQAVSFASGAPAVSSANTSNPALSKALSSVVNQLNCLSGSAASAGPAVGYPMVIENRNEANVNIGDLLLIPLGFIPANVRIGFVALSTFLSIWLFSRDAKNEKSRDRNVVLGSIVLLIAIVSAIGHFNLLQY